MQMSDMDDELQATVREQHLALARAYRDIAADLIRKAEALEVPAGGPVCPACSQKYVAKNSFGENYWQHPRDYPLSDCYNQERNIYFIEWESRD